MAENKNKKQTRIFLWSWPRSISTAIEKCLSFVDGVQAWFEPYTLVYMLTVNQSDDITKYKNMMTNLGKQPNKFSNSRFQPMELFTYPFVKSQLEEEEPNKQYILIKEMSASIIDHYDALPDVPTRHTFLIRHPYRVLVSHKRMMYGGSNFEGDLKDFDLFTTPNIISEGFYGTNTMHTLWKHVVDTGKEPNPIIIDAEDFMNYPDKIIPKYLEALGIPFHEKYLTWDASEDILQTWRGALEQILMGKMSGIYTKAFESSCFLPNTHPLPTKEELTPDIMKIADMLLPGYEEMFQNRIIPE